AAIAGETIARRAAPATMAGSRRFTGELFGVVPRESCRGHCGLPSHPQTLRESTEGLCVDLFEYQAKELFAAHGVPVTRQAVATTPDEAKAAAAEIGGQVVVKAQVKTGGRGKAGGVKLAENPDEAYEKAQAILGLDIKGHVVQKVLVTEASDIAEE